MSLPRRSTDAAVLPKISDEDYLRYDPFEGDRDVDIRCRTVKLVTVRKPQKCHGLDAKGHGHEIKVGERAKYETAIVDGEWGRFYVCIGCMTKWLTEACGMKAPPSTAARKT